MEWLPGILLLVVGAAWLLLRATIEKKAGAGSFWSHFFKQLSVIRSIPIVGWIWTVLPLLMMVFGVMWLAGWVPTWLRYDVPTPACAAIRSKPAEVSPLSWPRYACKTQVAAGDAWATCLTRTAYTDDPKRGCPGLQRCCPP